MVSQSVAVMRHPRALATPRRTSIRVAPPLRQPAPALRPAPAPLHQSPAPLGQSSPPPRQPAQPPRGPEIVPTIRRPAIALMLRPPAIALALGQSVIALLLRRPRFADTLRRPAIAVSAALPYVVFGLKLGAGALAAGVVALAIINNRDAKPTGAGFELASNETVVFRRPSPSHAGVENEDALDEEAEQPVSYYRRAI